MPAGPAGIRYDPDRLNRWPGEKSDTATGAAFGSPAW